MPHNYATQLGVLLLLLLLLQPGWLSKTDGAAFRVPADCRRALKPAENSAMQMMSGERSFRGERREKRVDQWRFVAAVAV